MRRRDLQLHGQTDSEGNFLMANRLDMVEFFKLWPGAFFTMSVEVTKTEPLSVPLLVYYKKSVVPNMKDAYLRAGEQLTLQQTDTRLRESSPITVKEVYDFDLKKWGSETLDLESLDTQQLVFFVEHIKAMAAQEFNVWVEDPTSLIN